MHFTKATVAAVLLASSSAAAFSQKPTAFLSTRTSNVVKSASATVTHPAGCACPSCLNFHMIGCSCGACGNSAITALFSTAEETEAATEDVPAEVEAMDGVLGEDEAHNADRPARKSLKKKGPRGKALSEFSAGDVLQGKVKTITPYGAFVDIGASTEGLLHISQLSVDFIDDVGSVVEIGQDVEVRILNIDEKKGQVALTLLSEKEEQKAQDQAASSRSSRPQQQQQQRRDDSAVLTSLKDKGWSTEEFVQGKVVSTVDFGAFVRIDVSQLNSELVGELDGLVHISALSAGRAKSVTSVVNVDDTVKVRVKGIQGSKVSLSMVSVEDEEAMAASRGGGSGPEPMGNKDWKEALEKLQETMPTFKNGPVVVDMRKN